MSASNCSREQNSINTYNYLCSPSITSNWYNGTYQIIVWDNSNPNGLMEYGALTFHVLQKDAENYKIVRSIKNINPHAGSHMVFIDDSWFPPNVSQFMAYAYILGDITNPLDKNGGFLYGNPIPFILIHNGTIDNNTSDSTNTPSTATIVGVSVGCSIAILMIVLAILYYYYRKKKNKQDFKVEESDPRKKESFNVINTLLVKPYENPAPVKPNEIIITKPHLNDI